MALLLCTFLMKGWIMGLVTKTVIMKWNVSNRKHYENKGYKFTKYKDEFEIKVNDLSRESRWKITYECDECKEEYEVAYATYLRHKKDDNSRYCFSCNHKLFTSKTIRKTLLKKSISFELWCVNNHRQDILDRWDYELNNYKPNEISYKTKLKKWFKCPCGLHKSELKSIQSITMGYTGSILCIACNSIGQWLINNYGENALNIYWGSKNTLDPFNISKGNKKKVWFKCNICENEKFIDPYSFTNINFSCNKCGDGVSYPNKLAFNLLEQLDLEFIPEYNPDWIKPKKYDFYFKLNNKQYILEMDGGFHYSDNNMNGTTKEETNELDNYKDLKAKEHGIEVIRIDCNESNLEYIKNNLLSSKLAKFLDLTNINWEECQKYSLSSLIKSACDLWASGLKDTTVISEKLKIARGTAINYLTKGAELNWCQYNGMDESSKEYIRKSVKVYCIELNKIYNSTREAERELGIDHSSIIRCCKGKQHTAGTFENKIKLHWMYYEDYLKLHKEIKSAN